MEVFLSYASEDEKLAEDVALAIAGGGYKVFFDHETLRAGDDYHVKLREAVKRAHLFVFLISADSIAPRKYALTELKYARQKWDHPRGRVLPVVVRPVALTDVPPYLRAVTLLEPEGNIPAEIAQEVSLLLPHPTRPPRPRTPRLSARAASKPRSAATR